MNTSKILKIIMDSLNIIVLEEIRERSAKKVKGYGEQGCLYVFLAFGTAMILSGIVFEIINNLNITLGLYSGDLVGLLMAIAYFGPIAAYYLDKPILMSYKEYVIFTY